MKKILLIGASGQLGTRIFRKLTKAEYTNIRILLREDSRYQHLLSAEPEVFVGDLRNAGGLRPALHGVDTVITTANSAAPRKKEDGFKSVDIQGTNNLVDEAKRAGVGQFIFTSIKPLPPGFDEWIPLAKAKKVAEDYLAASGLNYTILQPDAFMDVYFTFLGTEIPTLGDEAPLIKRDFKFMQTFFKGIKDDIARGKIGVIGDGKVRHSYITVDNVAEFVVKVVEEPSLMNQKIPLGGPEALSTLDIKAIFEKVLEKELKTKRTPAFMMKLMGNLLAPFSTNASNIMKLNYLSATQESIIDSAELANRLGIKLTTAEAFLRQKLTLQQATVSPAPEPGIVT